MIFASAFYILAGFRLLGEKMAGNSNPHTLKTNWPTKPVVGEESHKQRSKCRYWNPRMRIGCIPVVMKEKTNWKTKCLGSGMDCFIPGRCSYWDFLKVIGYWKFQKIIVVPFEHLQKLYWFWKFEGCSSKIRHATPIWVLPKVLQSWWNGIVLWHFYIGLI